MKVPTRSTPQVQSRGVQFSGLRVNTTLDDFGGDGSGLRQFAQGLDKASTAADAYFRDEQQKQGEMELLSVKQSLNDFELSLQNQGGALTLQGEDALGASTSVEKAFDDVVGKFRYSGASKGQIEALIESRRRSIMGNVTRHEQDQRVTLLKAQHAAGIESEIERFSVLPVDKDGNIVGFTVQGGKPIPNEQAFEGNIRTHQEALAEQQFGKKEGWSAETRAIVEERIQTDVSKGLRMNVERLIGMGKPREAEALFSRAREAGRMDEPDVAALEGVVQQATLAQDAQDWVDAHADKPFDQRVEAMRKIKDEKLRSEVRTKLTADEQLNEAIRKRNERTAEEGAYARMRKPNAAPLSAEERRVLGPFAVTNWEQTQAKVNAGIALEHNPRAWAEFTFLTTNELKTMTLKDYEERFGSRLDQAHYDAGLKALEAAREGKPTKYNGVNGLLSSTERVKKYARTAVGIPVDKAAKDLSEQETGRLAAFTEEVDRRLMAWSRQNDGASPGQEIVERVVAEVQVDRVSLDTGIGDGLEDLSNVPIATIPLDQLHLVTVDDAKPDELQQVTAIANRNGRTLTKDQQAQAVAYMRIAKQALLNPRLSPAIVREARVQWQRLTGRVDNGGQ